MVVAGLILRASRIVQRSLSLSFFHGTSHRHRLLPLIVMSNSCSNGIDVAGMRKKYKESKDAFLESDLVSKNPFLQFEEWFKVAMDTDEIIEANAMVLATATKDGKPSARYVLLKGYDENGFKFYTNYESRKGKELLENPQVALVFYWDVLNRSVRIEGSVERLSDKVSTTYFHSRPKSSQIGACISYQSTPIKSREDIITRDAALHEKYPAPDATIPKPDFWGGYIVKPEVIEFWQGQSNRIHDRIIFRRLQEGESVDGELLHQGENNWVYERLSP